MEIDSRLTPPPPPPLPKKRRRRKRRILCITTRQKHRLPQISMFNNKRNVYYDFITYVLSNREQKS